MKDKKFQIVVADPPWGAFGDKLTMSDVKRGAEANYSTMTTQQICDLPIKDIADPDGCVLSLWVPSSLLADGMKVMEAWGFQQKQSYIWVKVKKEPLGDFGKLILKSIKEYLQKNKQYDALYYNDIKDFIIGSFPIFSLTNILSFGLGRLFRQSHEICLIGINNTKIYKQLQNKSQRSVSFATNLKHSAKPEHLQNSLDTMFPNAKSIELFARRQRPGWVCVGNEVCSGEDIKVSLAKLL